MLGTPAGVPAVYDPHALAHVHTHPSDSGDGFSGWWVIDGGKDKTSRFHDYHVFFQNNSSAYVFRAGDKAGWYFDHSAFTKAGAGGGYVSASQEPFTRRVDPW